MLTHMRTVVISGGDTRKKDPRTIFVALQVYVVPSPPLFIVEEKVNDMINNANSLN